MLTAGDIQFEPSVTKIRFLTKSIMMMLAGDSEVLEEVYEELQEDIARYEVENPFISVRVRKVVEMYAKRRNEAHNRRAENTVLMPFGLTLESFHGSQQTLSSSFVEKIATELYNFEGPETEVIIAGLDATGPHIYVVKDSQVTCRDGVGFASIGAGAWHAESQLMFADQTPNTSLAETFLNVHFAKKRSEVAPGVGAHTDLVFIESQGELFLVGDHVKEQLDQVYKNYLDGLAVSNMIAKGDMQTYVNQLLDAPSKEPEKQYAALPTPEVRDAYESPSAEEVRTDSSSEDQETEVATPPVPETSEGQR